ncbi:hemolymph lipopolysaccharide-binding protein-like isoform X2 [Periplaneta americana]|uniref:hemolymph lipopolysaccharide-binding protein-like isoform X2 n=1 Tax=Periplaneta americana TaxID=6978 RepID=UPI0037E87139
MKIEFVMMYWAVILLFWNVCVAASEGLTCSVPALCEGPRTGEIKYSIIGHRNASGHWISRFDHEAGHTQGPWQVAIDQSMVLCGNKKYIHVDANIVVPPSRTHNPDYALVPGQGYYKYHSGGVTWDEARRKCEQEGAHLAIMNSEAEAKALAALITSGSWAHIGNWDTQKKGKFLTIFNQPLDEAGYNKWHPGEPDYPGVQNCGLLNPNSLLGNTPCELKFPFICEF